MNKADNLQGIYYCDFEVWDSDLQMMKKCGRRAKYKHGENQHVCDKHVQDPHAQLIDEPRLAKKKLGGES